MKAREVMTKSPKTCGPGHDARCALEIMQEEDCGIVPIIDGNGEARIVGVVTDRDIALHLGVNDAKPSSVPVERIMTREVVLCQPDAELEHVARRLEEARVRRILVADGKKLLGVISMADLARALKKERPTGRLERVLRAVSEPSQRRKREEPARSFERPRT